MYVRQIDSFRLDRTYGFQHYPILTIPDDVARIDAPMDSCCTQRCPYVNYCTYEVPYIEKINMSFEEVIAAFPPDLSVPNIYWAHTGQGPLSEMFEVIPEGRDTRVFAVNQRAALRIRKNNDSIITYMGFELENIKNEDVDFILYLARTVQECTSSPLFFCSKAVSKPVRPMLLNSADFEKWVCRK